MQTVPTFSAGRKKHRQFVPQELLEVAPKETGAVLSSLKPQLSSPKADAPRFDNILEAEELKEPIEILGPKRLVSQIVLTKQEESVFAELRLALDKYFVRFEQPTVKPAAFAVGGWVRDKLLGKMSKDIDVVVHPSELDYLECRLLELPKVRVKRLDRMGSKREVLRVDLKGVQFDIRGLDDLDLKKDTLTRDFDINAIYYNLRTQKIEDPLDAIKESLSKSVIRAAHNLANVFADKNRYLRLIRLKNTLGMEVDQQTLDYFSQTVRFQFRSMDREDKKRMAVELRKTFQQPSSMMKKIFEEYVSFGILDFLQPDTSRKYLQDLTKYLCKLRLILETDEAKILLEEILELEKPFEMEAEDLMVQGLVFFFYQITLKLDEQRLVKEDPHKQNRVTPGFGVPSFKQPIPKDLYYQAASAFFEDTPLKIFKRYYQQLVQSISEKVENTDSRIDKEALHRYILETDRNKITWAFLAVACEGSRQCLKENIGRVIRAAVQRGNNDPEPSKWNLPVEEKSGRPGAVTGDPLKLLSAGSLIRRNKKTYLREDDGWED